jgi:hypothetical protein
VATEESARLQLERREAEYFVDRTVNRLERGVVRVKQIDVEIISESRTEKR